MKGDEEEERGKSTVDRDNRVERDERSSMPASILPIGLFFVSPTRCLFSPARWTTPLLISSPPARSVGVVVSVVMTATR